MKTITEMLRIHYHQLTGEWEKASAWIQTEALKPGETPLEDAFWLWVSAQQIERKKDAELMKSIQKPLDEASARLEEGWMSPGHTIWREPAEYIQMANLGIYYGALQTVKRVTGKSELQRTLTAIRDYVFDYGLAGGMLIKAENDRIPAIDLLAAVMPFGLFSPEDLVIVEVVKELEGCWEELHQSPVGMAWLAWYFTEKGDLKKGKAYVEKAGSLEKNELADQLCELVHYYLNHAMSNRKKSQFIHTPYGNDNPYETLKTERSPKQPHENEHVTLHVQLWPEPLQADEEVLVIVQGKTVSCEKKMQGDERVWKADIGSFSFEETVDYYFVYKQDGQVITESDMYQFRPLRQKTAGDVCQMKKIEDVVWFLLEGGRQVGIELTTTGPRLLFGERESAGEGQAIHIVEEKQHYFLSYSFGSLTVKKEPFSLAFHDYAGKPTLVSLEDVPALEWVEANDGTIERCSFHFHTPDDEKFYGLGERYSQLEYRGEELDCYVYNQYRDQGNRTYMPVPFFMSSSQYGIHIENSAYTRFCFASEQANTMTMEIELEENKTSLLYFGGAPKDLVSSFTHTTGKPVLPPVWAFGPWMSSNNWDRDSVVREQIKLTNEHEIPATVLVLEQWSDEATYYIFNDADYKVTTDGSAHHYDDFSFPEWGRWPDPKGLFDHVHQNGLKVILWQIPIQKFLNQQAHLQKDADERWMLDHNYEVKTADGQSYRMPEGWFKESLLMDFSNEAGSKWWFSKRQYLLENGVDGFKTDGGEFVFGKTLQFADGKTGKERRNLYPNDYVGAYYNFTKAKHGAEALTFSRAGYTGAQNYPAHWAGDERSTFEAFRHSLIAGLSSGMSGIPFWGWDLAGFNGDIPTAELFIRSAQMAAFCPIMQYHAESKAEFNQDRTPWNIAERTGDKRAISEYRFYANVRMNLLPYIYAEAKKASRSGIPLMRSMWMEYPDSAHFDRIFDQYLFGDALLIAPIIEEGAISRQVNLPDGEWFDLWSGQQLKGPNQFDVEAPLNVIPVYVKSGNAIVTHTDETGELGTWVGNEVDRYHKNPVIRLYVSREGELSVTDHLDNSWTISYRDDEDALHIEVEGSRSAIIAYPMQAALGKIVYINGKTTIEQETSKWLFKAIH